MSKNVLTVLESPWDSPDGDIANHSMRPFVEGLCELHNWTLVYRTFMSPTELHYLVGGEAFSRHARRSLLYISCHGFGGRLDTGIHFQGQINLGSVARRLPAYARSNVEGVWIGACDVGASNSLSRFLDKGGAWWAGGYGCEVAWDAAMLIDLAVLNEAMSSPARKTTKEIAGLFTRSLRRFAADFVVSSDRRSAVELRDAVRLWGRQPYQSPKDVLSTVLHNLKWQQE